MKKVNKKIKKAVVLFLTVVMTLGVAGCGGKNGSVNAGDRTIIYYAPSYIKSHMRDFYIELVDTYNEGQGVEDGVYVEMVDTASTMSGLESSLRSNYMYDVIQINDDEFKALVMQGKDFFITLDEYLTDEVKKDMQWSDIPESLVNRFRMNTSVDENNIYQTGKGTELLAIPNGDSPQVLFYNKGILEQCGINIISVPENEMETYNSQNNATLKPHGYAEYKQAPFAGAKSSENETGNVVYKVFNECIAMNWEELRCVARAMQKQYGYEYGFMSEWWFNMGWSVGGDCIGWNESTKKYEFTLMDKQANYLALADITVNGNNYSKGDVLLYEDKLFLNNNTSEKASLNGKIYALPSQYDAILEFTRLGVPANKEVETGVYGYGVAPATTQKRQARFLTGKDCPFYIEHFSEAVSYKGVLGDDLGMTLPSQYREYVGGSTYANGGTEYLKVIGETYDGKVYTGDLHYEGDVAIVGRATTSSEAAGMFIPRNTINKNYDEAFKFVSWVAGPEGQAILSKSNASVPNQTTYGLTDYANSKDRIVPNMWAGAYLTQKSDIGDYTYFTTITWITEWSQTFNSTVREGRMTLSNFIKEKNNVANTTLKGMNIHMNGR